jgi:adenine-specific DNA methylase
LPVLLNKVALEYIPRFGQRLADDFRKWGDWVKRQAENDLADFYPKDADGSTPIAFLWARTVQCEGPGCGAEVPLIGRAVIAHRKSGGIALSLTSAENSNDIEVRLVEGRDAKTMKGTSKGFVATCPRHQCGYSTPKKSVQRQLTSQKGGADTSRLLAVLTEGSKGRSYRLTTPRDLIALEKAKAALVSIVSPGELSAIPDEPIPAKTAHRAVGSQLPLYGFQAWGDLFTSRQKLAITVLQRYARKAYAELAQQGDEQFARAVFLLLAFAVDKQADYSSSLCRWVARGEFIAGTLAGEKKFPMMVDFAESNPIGPGSGSWDNHIDWIARFIEHESIAFSGVGTVCQASADERTLPTDAAAAMITDPPYYDSVPYSDLSDYFYVWLRRTVRGIEPLKDTALTPKSREMTVNHPADQEEKGRYEALLTSAFDNGRDVTAPSGIAVIVFAHKSTSGWETLLEAIVKSGWIVTASWPIDTERAARLNALDTASLSSSVHIVCRPRENSDGSVRTGDIGDWRGVLQELPTRIHQWMPRLADEGVVGADAIFACLGPALEIFSRFSRVEKASGEAVTLREYLVEVWAAVAKEALMLVFKDADTTGFEPDARLTAMWLWTMSAGPIDSVASEIPDDGGDEEDDDGRSGAKVKAGGFTLEYDAARKIAQGLGASLDALTSVVEVSGDKARLLPVADRARYLFGKDEGTVPAKARGKKPKQADFFTELKAAEDPGEYLVGGAAPKRGDTTLDRVHQTMILFGTGRSEALKRFLVEDGIGREPSFWRLAQALSALYPAVTDEKRWVDGVLGRKKSLGF